MLGLLLVVLVVLVELVEEDVEEAVVSFRDHLLEYMMLMMISRW